MNKIYNPIVWVNNSPPALNEDNLNAMSQGLSDLDDRVIELAGDIVLSATECAEAAQAAQDAADTASAAAITATTKAGEAADSATAAAGSATTASTKAGEASTSATNAGNSATSASGSATSASTNALKSEGYAVGKQNGTDVTSESPYYENNAEYYATEAGSSAQAAAASATEAESWSAHPPYIGSNGNWYVWDVTDAQYEDSGIDASITVSVGTTSTLPAGSSATVTNSGTSTDPVLNFGIPQGAAGTDGVSPEVTISSITGGHTVTITDADHPSGQSFNVMDGAGNGDMVASTYDPNSSVANAGGIAEYVKKSEGRYNVINYGLVSSSANDTTTDNTTALNALLALVPNNSVIYFPVGIYNFASGISLTKSVTFVGENEEVQQAQNTFTTGNERPTSILRYTGAANATMFTRAGYCDVNFVGLVLDGGNYQVIDNTTAPTEAIKYEYCIDVPGTYTVNGIDVSLLAPGMIENCMFRGFSGYAVRNAMHHYIEGCGFYWCNKCIVTTFTDSLLHNLWFCKCHTAIFMSNLVIDNSTEENPQRTEVSVNVSDIWADQLTGHFIESDGGASSGGFVAATSAQIVASNLWIDHVQMSAFYLPSAFLASSRISGTFGRIGMNYAGLQDSDRTAAIAVESDFLYSGGYVQNSIFELNISNINGKSKIAPHNGECFSRLFTTMSSTAPNKDNKITCTKFPIARLIDLESIVVEGQTQRRTSNNNFNFTSYFGTDGQIDRVGVLDYVNGLHFHNNNPNTSTWAPYVGALYYNYNKHILYRCTAINIVSSSYTFTWEEVHRGTQFETMPSPGLNLVGLIAQYTGTTTSAYTHGYFYECVNENNVRKWVQRDVQDTSNLLDKVTYDPNDTVATAGGIVSYVSGEINSAVTSALSASY